MRNLQSVRYVRNRVGHPVAERMAAQVRNANGRVGATMVEFAFVSPIIFALFFGAIEFTRLNMVKNTAAIAAYEGARVAMVAGGSVDKGCDAARAILTGVGVSNDVEINGSGDLSFVELEIKVPMDKNAWGVSVFTHGLVVKEKMRLQREVVGD